MAAFGVISANMAPFILHFLAFQWWPLVSNPLCYDPVTRLFQVYIRSLPHILVLYKSNSPMLSVDIMLGCLYLLK
jgi:hypothetical protein